MIIYQPRTCILAAALSLLASTVAAPQTGTEKKEQPSTQQSSAAEAEKKRVLGEATRVSTSEAVRSAAKEATGKREKPSDGSAETDVLEFHPADHSSDARGGAVVAPSKEKKSAIKKIHGEAYGSAGAGGRGAGGAAGASSKSGKTSVYVETEHATSSPPR